MAHLKSTLLTEQVQGQQRQLRKTLFQNGIEIKEARDIALKKRYGTGSQVLLAERGRQAD